ncbi:LPXTG cell wall anchor domain-containing protein [Streptomyces mauvecolor]|uniref:LPXTG cell wall anchor domain-containing protein n=1 Tax=Streptomyces mauvecolor TaxID=58345 RepID=A0ABV9UFE6_9ACTN
MRRLPPATAAQPASFADHTSQTAVVPKVGVAAGAETTNNTGDHTPLIAAGAGTAALGAAGFVALRRRAARRV